MVNGYECGVSIGSGGNGAWGWSGTFESPTNCDTPSMAAEGPGSACGDSFAGKEHLGASLNMNSWEEMRRSPGSISAQSTDRRFVPQDSDSCGGGEPGQSGAGPAAGHVSTLPLNSAGIAALYAAQAALVASTMPNACSLNSLAAIAPLLLNRGIPPEEGSFAIQESSASSSNVSVSPSNQLLSASQRPGRGANMRLGAGKRASSTEKESPLSKRKAKNDLELDATEILVAEILSSGACPNLCAPA